MTDPGSLSAEGAMPSSEESRSGRVFLSIIAAGFLVALAVRLALLFNFPGNFDSESYRVVASIAERGGDLYAETDRYNYSPVWAVILRGLDRARAALKLDLTRAVGLTLTAADLATGALLYLLARRRSVPRRAALVALLFFANPVSVLLSSFHGQFDNLSILFLLASILVAGKEGIRGPLTVASLSLSLCLKHVTWFHPLLFAWRRRRGFSLAAATVPYVVLLSSFLPYWPSWRNILDHVFLYRGLPRRYGLDVLLLLFPGMPSWVLTALLLVAMLVALVVLARVEILRASLLLFLVQLIFLPGIARQYCVWPVALGALFPSAGYFVYTLVATGFLVGWLPAWNGIWWAAIGWLLWEVFALSRRRVLATDSPALPFAAGVRP